MVRQFHDYAVIVPALRTRTNQDLFMWSTKTQALSIRHSMFEWVRVKSLRVLKLKTAASVTFDPYSPPISMPYYETLFHSEPAQCIRMWMRVHVSADHRLGCLACLCNQKTAMQFLSIKGRIGGVGVHFKCYIRFVLGIPNTFHNHNYFYDSLITTGFTFIVLYQYGRRIDWSTNSHGQTKWRTNHFCPITLSLFLRFHKGRRVGLGCRRLPLAT